MFWILFWSLEEKLPKAAFLQHDVSCLADVPPPSSLLGEGGALQGAAAGPHPQVGGEQEVTLVPRYFPEKELVEVVDGETSWQLCSIEVGGRWINVPNSQTSGQDPTRGGGQDGRE